MFIKLEECPLCGSKITNIDQMTYSCAKCRSIIELTEVYYGPKDGDCMVLKTEYTIVDKS